MKRGTVIVITDHGKIDYEKNSNTYVPVRENVER
jgi:hypothetical protein